MAAFQCLQPFVGTLLAFLVLGEEPTLWDIGAVGVVAGLVLVAKDTGDLDAHPLVTRIRRILSTGSLGHHAKQGDLDRLSARHT